ncbi:MAG: hypothetical protein ACRDBY_00575 [Cetobacterium sp.]
MANKFKNFFRSINLGFKNIKARYDYLNDLEEKAFYRTPIENASQSGGPIVALVKRLGFRNGDVTSKEFEEPEYDFADIDSAYEVDSYVRQGVDKYIEQIFKEGYRVYGKNENAVEYVKLRLKFMAEATQTPTDQLLTEIAESMVKYHNPILVKARMADQAQLPPGATTTGLDGKEPIVGYFSVHPGTLKIKRDKNGTIQGWQQEVEGADKPIKFRPEDVVHIPYKRRPGNAFATPFLLSVLNDVKALRFLEENCTNMLYKHVNPMYHASVGDQDSPGTTDEIDEVTLSLNSMDVDGGIVTTNRVNIAAIESNKTVDARPYLDYLEARVFTGIGIPSVMFGRGGTANRNTADSMTAENADRIKAYQNAIETGITFYIVKELLMEGGFDPLNNPDDEVYFEFLENDLDRKIKHEVHATFMYEHNAIDENEMRDVIGRDPITDRGLMYQTLVTQANAQVEAQVKSQVAGTKATNQKNTPTNQHGTKSSSKKTTNALQAIIINDVSYLMSYYSIPQIGAETIIATLKDNIKKDNLSNKFYIDSFEERVEHLAKVFQNKNGGQA